MRNYKLCPLPEYIYFKPAAADTLRQPLSFITREMIADVYDSQLRGRKDISVCFTGHRIIAPEDLDSLSLSLQKVLECLYQRGFRDFFSGAALGFDVLAAEHVLELRSHHPDVQLHLAIPCSSQADRWRTDDCHRYERLLYNADATHVLSKQYYEGCMQVRNRFMVDRSALCLCYLRHMKGGTMSTVSYAMEQSCPVLNLAMPDACDSFMNSLRNG